MPAEHSAMPAEHVDVLVVGAGLAGIGAACRLRQRHPRRTVAVFEARGAIGGTWDQFRYPGVRSDSDMFTLGYGFRPWRRAEAIADGPSIREYIRDTAREFGIDERIRFHHRVDAASWSSDRALWTVTAHRSDTGEQVTLTCSLLYVCSGYYRYDEGYTPQLPGVDRYEGRLVHPQHWPEELEHRGRRVVVIGSGATAVTLVPAMASDAAHVTMLQRSPSYVMALPSVDPLARLLKRVLPDSVTFPVVRWKNALTMGLFFRLSRRAPGLVRQLIERGVRSALPDGFDVDRHFSPEYRPWDQRLCFVPDGDLFRTLRRGDASVVTDTIDTFTPDGIRLTSGAELAADIVVTATGLNLLAIGGIALDVDGEPVDVGKAVTYKGMMLDGVPNFAMTIGYTNASWTLKADLVAEYVCRLLTHLDEHDLDSATPVLPPGDRPAEPLIDLQAGYVLRSIDRMPKQGHAAPWRLHQNYVRDVWHLRHGSVTEDMDFGVAAGRRQSSLSGGGAQR
ncbi:cation diffusion facilitator CzcD-associated flavoprotein CzcO [Prauserella sediminis]|uniref:Cation diffusion facilitator CzcD-associated flavoprotein CzcO n=2 Tax=Prauserella sediminis TaxID=577680 RepID=A0A839XUB9_9PSEU|nr:cation diffusion facilitator CzcD-associated flavoprotein CzcO [Prauserella sediminis]